MSTKDFDKARAAIMGEGPERIEHIRSGFCATPLGAKIWQWLREEKINIVIEKMKMTTSGCVRGPHYDTIYLNSYCRNDDLIFTLAHEARHIWQSRQMAKLLKSKPVLRERFTSNPWSHRIFQRMIEADAFSFDFVFLLDYFAKEPGRKTIGLSETAKLALGAMGYERSNLPDNPDLTTARRMAFELFFMTDNMVESYDPKSAPRLVDVAIGSFIIGLDRAISKVYKKGINTEKLREDYILALGEDAWGEMGGKNYLADEKGNFEMKPHYTSRFNKVARRRLKRLAWSPQHMGMNTYIRKDGRKEKLISF